MAGISEAAFSQGDVMRRLAQLEAQVRELTAGRRLEAASIGAGGVTIRGGSIRVLDDAGQTVIELGKTPDGRYDLDAVNTLGQKVSLLTLAFGTKSADANANQVLSDTAGAFVDLTGGPAVTDVLIGSSGRAFVTVSADILCAPTGADGRVEGWMGFAISGATTVAPGVYESLRARFTRDSDVAGNPAVNVGVSRLNLVTGLNPGLHTFTAKYRAIVPGAGDEVEFMSRNITVEPF